MTRIERTDVMRTGFIEHVNLTVSQPERSAKLLADLFGWHVRWQGPARDGAASSMSATRPIISPSMPSRT